VKGGAVPNAAVLSQRAKDANETKRLNEWRAKQNLPPLKGPQAKREKDAIKAAGNWGDVQRMKIPGNRAPRTPQQQQPPASTTPASTTPASVSPIADKMRVVAAADPAAAFAATLGNWSNDGKWFSCWTPDSKGKIKLKVEPKPGPFTPDDDVAEILGQPELIHTMALAIKEGEHFLIEGPTSNGKSEAVRWLAKQLNWNYFAIECHKNLEAEDFIGDYLPVPGQNDQMLLRWIYGTVAKAILASKEHPTLAVFEEMNRVGDTRVFARLYKLLDGSRTLVIDQKEDPATPGLSEMLKPGEKLIFGATQNPVDVADDDVAAGNYIGVQELDPALRRRFPFQLMTGYPDEEAEAEALRLRVNNGLSSDEAMEIVKVATAVRQAPGIAYPMGFMDLVAWAKALHYLPWEKAAELAFLAKAHPDYREAMRQFLQLRPNAAGVTP
jgi:MoxR-like ATPase